MLTSTQDIFTFGSSHLTQAPPSWAISLWGSRSLGNRSLFKSFMSSPWKRKARRKLWKCNEGCVIVSFICNDLWHDGCYWFDNHSLFPLRKEESYSQQFLPVFLSFLLSRRWHFLFIFCLPTPLQEISFLLFHLPSCVIPINILLKTQTQKRNKSTCTVSYLTSGEGGGGISWYHKRALKLKSALGIVSGRTWGSGRVSLKR